MKKARWGLSGPLSGGMLLGVAVAGERRGNGAIYPDFADEGS